MAEERVLKGVTLRARIITILTFDFTIMVLFLLIPAGIVNFLEPCIENYGYILWYVFTTVSTIGFGDYVAGMNTRKIGSPYYNCVSDNKSAIYHQDNFFWV